MCWISLLCNSLTLQTKTYFLAELALYWVPVGRLDENCSFNCLEMLPLRTVWVTVSRVTFAGWGELWRQTVPLCSTNVTSYNPNPTIKSTKQLGTCELEIFSSNRITNRIGGYHSNFESNQGVVIYVFNADNNYYYRRTAVCGFSWFLKRYCTIAPTVLASVYALAT